MFNRAEKTSASGQTEMSAKSQAITAELLERPFNSNESRGWTPAAAERRVTVTLQPDSGAIPKVGTGRLPVVGLC
jgi:hypothetical protein